MKVGVVSFNKRKHGSGRKIRRERKEAIGRREKKERGRERREEKGKEEEEECSGNPRRIQLEIYGDRQEKDCEWLKLLLLLLLF